LQSPKLCYELGRDNGFEHWAEVNEQHSHIGIQIKSNCICHMQMF
jgi:hypothetical protein